MAIALKSNLPEIITSNKTKTYKEKQLAHSSRDVWNTIARVLGNHVDSSILQVNCGLSYLVDYLYNHHSFKRIKGIDIRQDLIQTYQKTNPQLTHLVWADNFFRSNFESKINDFDVYIFSSCLEYYDDPSLFLDRIPKGKTVVICYPNFDDGLVCSFFESKEAMKKKFESTFDNIEIHESILYSIPEFLIDQKIFILFGTKI